MSWSTVLSGAGAALATTAGETNAPGIYNLSTGTTTTGYTIVYSGQSGATYNTFLFGGGSAQYMLEIRFRMPTLVDGTEQGQVRLGFMDANVGGDATDGVYLKFSNASANFRYINRNNSTETDTDSGLAAVANTWYKWRCVINTAASSVTHTIDDASSQTVASNIPSGAGRQTTIQMQINKAAGTTARALDVDYAWLLVDFNSSR
jgi:hypothetical protein